MRLHCYIFAVYWLAVSIIAEDQQNIIICNETESCVINCQNELCGEAVYINAYNATNLLVLCNNDKSKCHNLDIVCPYNQKQDNFCKLGCTVDNACDNVNLLNVESNLVDINCAHGIESCNKIIIEADKRYTNTVNIVCDDTVCDGMNIIANNYELYFNLECRGSAVCNNLSIVAAEIAFINATAHSGGEIYDSQIILNDEISLKMDVDVAYERNTVIFKRHYLSIDLAVFGDLQSIRYSCQLDGLIESDKLNILYTIEEPAITINGYYDPNENICSYSNSTSTRRRLGVNIKKFISYVPDFISNVITSSNGDFIGGLIATVIGYVSDKLITKISNIKAFQLMSVAFEKQFKKTALYRLWVALPEIAQDVFEGIAKIIKAGIQGAATGAAGGAITGKIGGAITGAVGGGFFGPLAVITVPLGIGAGAVSGALAGAIIGAKVGFVIGAGKEFISVVGTVSKKYLDRSAKKYIEWEMSQDPEVARKIAIGLWSASRKTPQDKIKKFGYYWMHSELKWDPSKATFSGWVDACIKSEKKMTKSELLYFGADHSNIAKYLAFKKNKLHYKHKDIEMMMAIHKPAEERPQMYYELSGGKQTILMVKKKGTKDVFRKVTSEDHKRGIQFRLMPPGKDTEYDYYMYVGDMLWERSNGKEKPALYPPYILAEMAKSKRVHLTDASKKILDGKIKSSFSSPLTVAKPFKLHTAKKVELDNYYDYIDESMDNAYFDNEYENGNLNPNIIYGQKIQYHG
eukprot:432373_1